MADDDYRYQMKPLPKGADIGANAVAATQIQSDPVPNFPFGSDSQLDGPWGNPSAAGNYGSGSLPSGCEAEGKIGGLGVSAIQLPCDTPTSSITEAGANFQDSNASITIQDGSGNVILLDVASGPEITLSSPGGGVTIILDIPNGQIYMQEASTSKSIRLRLSDLDNGDEAAFREYEICAGQMIKVLSTEAV